jgi:hypothetical protein
MSMEEGTLALFVKPLGPKDETDIGQLIAELQDLLGTVTVAVAPVDSEA